MEMYWPPALREEALLLPHECPCDERPATFVDKRGRGTRSERPLTLYIVATTGLDPEVDSVAELIESDPQEGVIAK